MIKKLKRQKCIALLLDPDSYNRNDILNLFSYDNNGSPDFILVGGSLTSNHPDIIISAVKKVTDIPVALFPGSLMQLSDKADIILLLSLISGRNPELLIGNHVVAAPYLSTIKSDIIPTGYILINCGARTSVEYMSNTEAIPSKKTDIAVATAMAGEMLGLQLIYLEGGSGAEHPVPQDMIRSVHDAVSVPVVVGGGLRTANDISAAFYAGADMIVIGNGYENNHSLLEEACRLRDEL